MLKFLILAASSFGLGALHALEPGHGKTVVGAYLIGSRGRARDAVFLGMVVTFSHTGVVVILGVLSVVAAQYFVPQTVQKVLEVVSGLLIVGVGGWMIGVRVRQARAHSSHEHPHMDHGHDHDHGHEGLGGHHDRDHNHAADRAHAHDAEHDPEHGHEHSHGHGHSHGPVLPPGQRASLGQLIALGISGGIVPCPAALAVLLTAVGYRQVASGVSLVVVFSLGMAATLTTIGLIMVKAAGLASRYVSGSRWTRRVPIVSAVIITLVGVGLTAKAVVDALA